MANYTLPYIPGYRVCTFQTKEVYRRESDGRLFNPDMTPVIPYTPSELRQQAYENDAIISYNDKMMTVDEAEKLFWQYFPEDNECCDELKTLIKNAKAQIREMYPDEN